MKQDYTPFFLDQEQHDFAWRAYFGGMTGAQALEVIREPVSNVIYGDLDGAYNASGQNLEVFKWTGARWLDEEECLRIIREVEDDPSTYWKYGSLHLEVDGSFDNIPLRVGTCSKDGTPILTVRSWVSATPFTLDPSSTESFEVSWRPMSEANSRASSE